MNIALVDSLLDFSGVPYRIGYVAEADGFG